MARARKVHPTKMANDEISDQLIEHVQDDCATAVQRIKRTYDPLNGIQRSIFLYLLWSDSTTPSRIAGYIDKDLEDVERALTELAFHKVVEYDEGKWHLIDHIGDWELIKDAIGQRPELLGRGINIGVLINKLVS
jgi:hypothetical protein